MKLRAEAKVPFGGALCGVLALPGVVGWVAWFVLPELLEKTGDGGGMLLVPFLLALAATSFGSAMIALMLGAPRWVLAVNLLLNVGYPVFLVVMWFASR